MIQLTPSLACCKLIEQYEGLGGYNDQDDLCHPYYDLAHIPTIGYGSTYLLDGSKVTMSTKPITKAQAEQLLLAKLKGFSTAINQMLKLPVNQNQFDALCSLCYNIGAMALANSTLMHLLNQGLPKAAADHFLDWNKAHVNGQLVPVQGLTNRRQAERHLFLS